jgi:glycolate oxidase FAD binding subunit
LPLSELAPQLAEHKQFLPLAVPFTSRTTVGGTIATGVDSPLRQFYGTARDFVLGIEFVTGEGVRTKSGGRVVKNVAGYDLHKLMIGALGSLGVITSVNFRTFPVPLASRGFVASFADLESALAMRKRILESPLQPLTLEILSPALAQIFHRQAPTTLGEDLGPPGTWLSASEWTLAASFGGNDRLLERHAAELTRLAEQLRATSAAVLDDAERPLLWGRLRECIPMLLEASPLTTIFKISALGTQFGRLLNALRAMLERRELPLVALVRSAGVIYLALLPSMPGPEGLDALGETAAQAIEHGVTLGEHVTIPWCPPALKRRVNVWGPRRGDFALMQKMKQTFDPHNILNPGRYVGGL